MILIQSTFNVLGQLINMEKSILTSEQRIEYIGAVLVSTKAKVFLLQLRYQMMKAFALDLRHILSPQYEAASSF